MLSVKTFHDSALQQFRRDCMVILPSHDRPPSLTYMLVGPNNQILVSSRYDTTRKLEYPKYRLSYIPRDARSATERQDIAQLGHVDNHAFTQRWRDDSPIDVETISQPQLGNLIIARTLGATVLDKEAATELINHIFRDNISMSRVRQYAARFKEHHGKGVLADSYLGKF